MLSSFSYTDKLYFWKIYHKPLLRKVIMELVPPGVLNNTLSITAFEAFERFYFRFSQIHGKYVAALARGS